MKRVSGVIAALALVACAGPGGQQAGAIKEEPVNYPGAVHAFTNPAATENGKKFNLPLAYHAEADKQSKDETRKFLGGVFGM